MHVDGFVAAALANRTIRADPSAHVNAARASANADAVKEELLTVASREHAPTGVLVELRDDALDHERDAS